jgi:very-short-patch-repair endonuclease
MPIANFDNKNIEKAEVDFLVFHNKEIMILEVDGEHHNEAFMKGWDSKRYRIFLRHGISTVRFPAKQCWENSSAVVQEFLGLFN